MWFRSLPGGSHELVPDSVVGVCGCDRVEVGAVMELPDVRCNSSQVWADPPEGLVWSVLDDDGEAGRKFNREGPAEVNLAGRVPGHREAYVVTIPFPTLAQARRAGKVLLDAFREANAISDEPVPQPDDGHEHQLELHRYSRNRDPQEECVLCGAVLSPAVPR